MGQLGSITPETAALGRSHQAKMTRNPNGGQSMTTQIEQRFTIDRRRLLTVTASGVSAVALGALGGATPAFAADLIRWVSPRGTIEVLDDYPYWVPKNYTSFAHIPPTPEP